MTFNAERLRIARERRKLTKKALASACGVDQKTIIRYEGGGHEPPPESLALIAQILEFPEAFFLGDDVDEAPAEAVSFRSLKSLLARDKKAALVSATFAFLLNDWIESRFRLPEPDLPTSKEDTDPETAVVSVRQRWGLGERGVRNMVQLLESKGVRVFSLNEDTRALDAFSMWRGETPFVFLNTNMTAERSRFDTAHELGHLVLHRHGDPSCGRTAEDEANRFASAFLMPEADIRSKLPRIRFIGELVQAKTKWGVSVAALNYRLHKLKITSDWQYRKFCMQISQQFGIAEPNEMQRERSTVWEKVLGYLREERITKHKIAESLLLPVSEIESLLFQLVNMQSIDGGDGKHSGSRASLQLVKT